MDTTEEQLKMILSQLLKATKQDDEARKTAVRWFNRLYYDFNRWSDATFESIRSHEALSRKPSKKDLKQLKDHLQELQHSLYYVAHDRQFNRQSRRRQLEGRELQSEFCDNLELLAARFERDFEWLEEKDPDTFYELEYLIGMAESFPGSSLQIFKRMFSSLNTLIAGALSGDEKTIDRDKLLQLLGEHERSSQEAIQGLNKVAREARITLLNVNEYQSLLQTEGSSNPDVMVIGEVSVSQDTITVRDVVGPVNVKSHLNRVSQQVTTAVPNQDDFRNELRKLIEKLGSALDSVDDQLDAEKQRITDAATSLTREVSRPKTEPKHIHRLLTWLKDAASDLGSVAKPVLDVVERIGKLVTEWMA